VSGRSPIECMGELMGESMGALAICPYIYIPAALVLFMLFFNQRKTLNETTP